MPYMHVNGPVSNNVMFTPNFKEIRPRRHLHGLGLPIQEYADHSTATVGVHLTDYISYRHRIYEHQSM
jgi:hypothetical protein